MREGKKEIAGDKKVTEEGKEGECVWERKKDAGEEKSKREKERK